MSDEVPVAGYLLYHGLGGLADVDLSAPVAWLAASGQPQQVSLQLVAGQTNVLVARAVSTSGLEEQSACAATSVLVGQDGSLLGGALAAAVDVTVELVESATALLGWTVTTPPGFAEPTQFEVYGDGGSGRLDLQTPLAVVDRDPQQLDLQVRLAVTQLPMRFAVRARRGDQLGPLSRTVTLTPPAIPQPQLL